jgi:mannose-6-phosphate isomerase-like protein (cupin superfamily)
MAESTPLQWTSFHFDDLHATQHETGEPWLEFLRVPSLRAGLYVLPPGAWDHQSPHEEDEIYYVVSGRATFEAGAERRQVGAGSIIYVAAHQEHRFTDIVEELRVLVFFAAPPARK